MKSLLSAFVLLLFSMAVYANDLLTYVPAMGGSRREVIGICNTWSETYKLAPGRQVGPIHYLESRRLYVGICERPLQRSTKVYGEDGQFDLGGYTVTPVMALERAAGDIRMRCETRSTLFNLPGGYLVDGDGNPIYGNGIVAAACIRHY